MTPHCKYIQSKCSKTTANYYISTSFVTFIDWQKCNKKYWYTFKNCVFGIGNIQNADIYFAFESFCATCVIHQIHKAKQKYIRTTVKMLFSSGNICSADLCFALSWEFDRNANVGLTKCMTRLHHLSLAHYFPILQTLICMVVCSTCMWTHHWFMDHLYGSKYLL